MIGKAISHYKILEKIGEGGMGVVYKAEDTKLKRSVALKFLPPEWTRDQEAKQRFIQEAQAAAALDHSNICTVYEIDEVDGKTFIAMAYIQGQNLKDRLASGLIEIGEAQNIASRIAEGLKEAHDKGIIHRDIKPANIMLTKTGQVKIMDFGLAKLEWGVDLTKTATIMGTVAYMSPEQAKGEAVDRRTDIWSLGATLYEMLASERPFRGSHDQAAFYSILNEEPEAVSKLREGVPKELDSIVQKALKKDPSDRYVGMQDFISDLRSVASASQPSEQSLKISMEEKAPSIAVLPFLDMSPQKDQEYFCDGLAEELINALTQVKDLRVVARTSAFSFKGEKIDVREIGKKLTVKTVLEGSIRKAGNRLRITAQLINVDDGYHLWSEKFDRDLEDIFAIQDEISLAIVTRLKDKLLGSEKVAVLKRHTENPKAYTSYLMGEHYNRMRTPEGFAKAITYFNQALELDPHYALAFKGIGHVYILQSHWGSISPHDAYPKGREYLKKALDVDGEYADALAVMALADTFYEWDWEGAENRFKHALQRNPNSTETCLYYSYLLAITGRHDEAVSLAMRSCELDPLSAVVTGYAGHTLYKAGRYDEAIEHTQQTLSLHPDSFIHHFVLGYLYQKKSLYEKAIQFFEKSVELSRNASMLVSLLARAYSDSGNKSQAEKLLEELKERSRHEYVPPVAFFHIYYAFGDRGKAEEWLKRACDERCTFLPWYINNSDENYRIPRIFPYKEIIEKTGLLK